MKSLLIFSPCVTVTFIAFIGPSFAQDQDEPREAPVHEDARDRTHQDDTERIHVGRPHTPIPVPIHSPTPFVETTPTPTPMGGLLGLLEEAKHIPQEKSDLPPLANCKQFEADIETEAQGVKVAAHVAVDGTLVRSDITAMGVDTTMIVDAKEQKFSQLLPSQKLLVKIPWSDDFGKLFNPSKMTDGKWVKQPGGEEVRGVACDVWHVTEPNGEIVVVDMNGKTGEPVKIAAEDGSFTVYWRNFKVGPVNATKFTLPTDYKVMELPAGMKMPQLAPPTRMW